MKLKVKETLEKILTDRIFVDIPYSNFAWDSSNKCFNKTSISSLIPSGYEYIGCIVEATNGAAVMDAYRNTSLDILRVVGWVPSVSTYVNNSYAFKCTMILKKVGGVLRNPVIARLSAISKIGGGVDEGHSQGVACKDPRAVYLDVYNIYADKRIKLCIVWRMLLRGVRKIGSCACRNKRITHEECCGGIYNATRLTTTNDHVLCGLVGQLCELRFWTDIVVGNRFSTVKFGRLYRSGLLLPRLTISGRRWAA